MTIIDDSQASQPRYAELSYGKCQRDLAASNRLSTLRKVMEM
jgi:hypothetical protein